MRAAKPTKRRTVRKRRAPPIWKMTMAAVRAEISQRLVAIGLERGNDAVIDTLERLAGVRHFSFIDHRKTRPMLAALRGTGKMRGVRDD